MENRGKNQRFVHFFSVDVDEKEVLKEARKYVKEEWMKHIKVRKVKYSVKKLEADFIDVKKIIETQIRVHPELFEFLSYWSIDYGNNAVSIAITDPAQFQSLLKEKGITFPETVRVSQSTKFVDY